MGQAEGTRANTGTQSDLGGKRRFLRTACVATSVRVLVTDTGVSFQPRWSSELDQRKPREP